MQFLEQGLGVWAPIRLPIRENDLSTRNLVL